MNKFSLFTLIFLVGAVLLVASCKEQTELAFINSADSEDSINTIVWADGDVNWEKTGGYAEGEETSSKEVSELDGDVICNIDDGTGEFVTGVVQVEGKDGNSLSLDEGSSETYTLIVTSAE